MEDNKPEKKKIKKIKKKIVPPQDENIEPDNTPKKIVIPENYVVPSPVSQPSATWTKEDNEKLREFINNKMSVQDIAKIMKKSESNIRFQMKMVMFGDDRKDPNITNLLDGVKQTHKSLDMTKLYNDQKLLNMMTIFLFFDKLKDDNEYYHKLCDQVKKDCINKIISIAL